MTTYNRASSSQRPSSISTYFFQRTLYCLLTAGCLTLKHIHFRSKEIKLASFKLKFQINTMNARFQFQLLDIRWNILYYSYFLKYSYYLFLYFYSLSEYIRSNFCQSYVLMNIVYCPDVHWGPRQGYARRFCVGDRGEWPSNGANTRFLGISFFDSAHLHKIEHKNYYAIILFIILNYS